MTRSCGWNLKWLKGTPLRSLKRSCWYFGNPSRVWIYTTANGYRQALVCTLHLFQCNIVSIGKTVGIYLVAISLSNTTLVCVLFCTTIPTCSLHFHEIVFLYLLLLFFHEFNSDTARKCHVATHKRWLQCTWNSKCPYSIEIHTESSSRNVYTDAGSRFAN